MGRPSLALAVDRMCLESHFLRFQVLDRASIHLHPLQSHFAGSSSFSSWPLLVREVHRGRDGQYSVLYSVRRGAPV